ncbi:hypothetical protein [Janthinobacterium sp. AD80]|uniref:hypothetical protein n=1 Tax=Janthinobacterium sp. AD80 TaxID=1528773 RepID=UPI0011AEDFAA|nr:hypothetical protein [Janthinobacterium sp. AD80]
MKPVLLSLAVALSFISSQAHAEGAIIGKVAEVRIDSDGKGLVTFVDVITGTPPACAIAGYNHSMSFDAATAGGKAMYAMVLLAKPAAPRFMARARALARFTVSSRTPVFFS